MPETAARRASETGMRPGGRAIPYLGQRVVSVARRAPVASLACGLVAASLLFVCVPSLDLVVSGWFAGPHGGFPLVDLAAAQELRDVNRRLPALLLPLLGLVLILHALRLLPAMQLRPHKLLYILSVNLVGGLIVVHALKTWVGRARPMSVVPFGGEHPFSVAWQISDACRSSCSFVSGEAGSATALLAFLVLVPQSWRRPAAALLIPAILVFSLNRVAMGGHFLSDVVVAILLMTIVLLLLWPIFEHRADRIDRHVIGCALPFVPRVSGTDWRAINGLAGRIARLSSRPKATRQILPRPARPPMGLF